MSWAAFIFFCKWNKSKLNLLYCEHVIINIFQVSALWMRGRVYALEIMLQTVKDHEQPDLWKITRPVPSAAMRALTAPPGCSTRKMVTAGSRQRQTVFRKVQSASGELNSVQVDKKSAIYYSEV